MAGSTSLRGLKFYPVTPARWRDLETLFGERGAYGGCWCMFWRLKQVDFNKGNRANKRAMKKLVAANAKPGLLAYRKGEPIAWCSIAPREEYLRIERSRTLKRVDDQPVWSVACFFVAKPYRSQGLMVPFLKAAIEYAGKHGAKIVEGYPIEPGDHGLSGYDGYTGVVSAFRKAGFEQVARPSAKYSIMRYSIKAT